MCCRHAFLRALRAAGSVLADMVAEIAVEEWRDRHEEVEDVYQVGVGHLKNRGRRLVNSYSEWWSAYRMGVMMVKRRC